MSRHIPRVYTKEIKQQFDIVGQKFIHLVSVLRLIENDIFFAFNEDDGEWLCSILTIKKNHLIAKKIKFIRCFEKSPKLALAFCQIKQDNSKLIIEKCTELGASDFYLINSKYTNHDVNVEKLKAIAMQASEQSERLNIPKIHEKLNLMDFLSNLPKDIIWLSAIEKNLENKSMADIKFETENYGFIIGPEGGFSEEEKAILTENTIPITISKNILRSETAAIVCISAFAILQNQKTVIDS